MANEMDIDNVFTPEDMDVSGVENYVPPKLPFNPEFTKTQAMMAGYVQGNMFSPDTAIEDELNQGEDSSLRNLRQHFIAERNQRDIVRVNELMGRRDLDEDQRYVELDKIRAEREARQDAPLRELFADEAAAKGMVEGAYEATMQRRLYDSSAVADASRDQVQALINDFANTELDAGGIEVTGDFVRSALSPGYGFELTNIIQDVVGDKIPIGIGDYALPGSAKSAFMEYWRNSDPEEKVELTKKLLTSIKDRSGTFMENDWEAYDFLQSLTSNLDPTAADMQTEAAMENVFHALDVVPLIGPLAVKLGRGIYRTSKTTASSVLNRKAPRTGGNAAAHAIKEAVPNYSDMKWEHIDGSPPPAPTGPVAQDLGEFIPKEALFKKVGNRFNRMRTKVTEEGVNSGLSTADEMVKSWNKEFGIDTKLAPDHPTQPRATGSYRHATKEIRLSKETLSSLAKPRNSVEFARAVETVAHEFGHALSRNLIRDTAGGIKDPAIAKAYQEWVTTHGSTKRSALTARRAGVSSIQAATVDKAGYKSLSKEYTISEEEWLADQGARYLLGLEMSHTGVVLNTVKKVAHNLKRIYKAITGEATPSAGKVTDAYREFLEEIRIKNPNSTLSITPKAQLGKRPNTNRLRPLENAWTNTKTADALGVGVDELTHTHLSPKPSVESTTVAMDSSLLVDEFKSIISRAINLSPEELENARNSLKEMYETAVAKAEVVPVNKMHVMPLDTGDGLRITQTIQKTDAFGFSSAQEATDAAERMVEYMDGAKVELRVKDGDVYRRPRDSDDVDSGEWVSQVTATHHYGKHDVLGSTQVFADNAVKGWMSQYLNKSSVFRSIFDHASSVAANKVEFVRARLREITDPFTKLKRKEQAIVLDALDVSEVEKRWMGYDELFERFGGSDRMVQGYLSIRDHAKITHRLEDERLVRQLKDDGYRKYDLPGEDNDWYIVRPVIEEEQHKVGSIFMADKGTVAKVSTDDIEQLKAQGYSVHESIDMITVDGKGTHYIAARDGEVKTLPDHGLLREIDGYIPRRYQVSHVVYKEVSKNINGVENVVQQIPVGMASTEAHAKKFLARLQQDISATYRIRESREIRDTSGLSPEYFDRTGVDYYRDRGRLTNHRGEEVSYLDDELRAVYNPIDALERQRGIIARHVGLDAYIDSSKVRWEKKYGKLMPDGKFPAHPRDLQRPAEMHMREMYDEAMAYMNHINLVGGLDLTYYREMSTKLMTSLANHVSNWRSGREGWWDKVVDATSIGIMENRHLNPLDHLRTLAFFRSIVFNPPRQLILQSQSMINYLGIDHGFKYFASGRGIKDMTALATGIVARNTGKWDEMAKTIAKSGDMSKQEVGDLVEGFQNSGLYDAIDSHQYASVVALGPRNTANAGIPRRITEQLRKVAGLSRKMGFDAGESMNIMAAFLAARNKAIKTGGSFLEGYNPKLPWNSKGNLDLISGYANSLAFNMNKAGAQRYQKGALGVFFQFYSHVLKSAQVMIPQHALGRRIGKLSDKAFSDAEKFRIALANATFFGPAGAFGIVEAYNGFKDSTGIVVPEEVDMAVTEGIIGSTVNMVVRMADDPETESKVVFSNGMAPFSGLYGTKDGLIKAFDAIFTNDFGAMSFVSAAHGVLGSTPALSTSSSSVDVIRKVALLGGDVVRGDQDNPVPVIDAALSWFPVYNNFLRGRIAQKLGTFHTTHSNPTVRAAAGEAYAKMLLGLQTERETDVRLLMNELQGDYAQTLGTTGVRRALDDSARSMYRDLKTRMLAFSPGEAWSNEEMWESIEWDRRLKKALLSEEEYHYMMERFMYYWYNDKRENREHKLTELLIDGFTSGYIPPDQKLLRRIDRIDFEGKDELMGWLYGNLDIKKEDLYIGE